MPTLELHLCNSLEYKSSFKMFIKTYLLLCSQRSNLQSHKRATHYDDKRYKCMECGKGFKRRRLLDYHIKAAHTGERPYKCGVCAATFIYPEHFKKHRRIHTGEKPYLCEVSDFCSFIALTRSFQWSVQDIRCKFYFICRSASRIYENN